MNSKPLPFVIPLSGTLTVSEVLQSSWHLFRSQFWTLSLWGAGITLALYPLTLLLCGAVGGLTTAWVTTGNPLYKGWGICAAMVALLSPSFFFLVDIGFSAWMAVWVHETILDLPAVPGIWSKIRLVYWRSVGSKVLEHLGPLTLLLFLTLHIWTLSTLPQALQSWKWWLTLIPTLLGVGIGSLYWFLRTQFTLYASATEGLKPLAALKRSFSLTGLRLNTHFYSANYLRLFLVRLLVGFFGGTIQSLCTFFIEIVGYIPLLLWMGFNGMDSLTDLGANGHSLYPFIVIAFAQTCGFTVASLFRVWRTIMWALFYQDGVNRLNEPAQMSPLTSLEAAL